MLFVRDIDAAPRDLTPLERRVTERALVECRVAGPALARRATEIALILPRMPRFSEVRGPRSLVAHLALASRADGIALGRRVFIKKELFGPDGSLPIDLVAHEVTHVAQFLREGPLAFYTRYLRSYAAGRTSGLDGHSAYLAIPYEIEARAVAAAALRR